MNETGIFETIGVDNNQVLDLVYLTEAQNLIKDRNIVAILKQAGLNATQAEFINNIVG